MSDMVMRAVCRAFSLLLLVPTVASAQGVASAATAPVTPPPPATKLEAFKPAAGSIVTFGFNELGRVSGVSVDAREMRDTRSSVVRGVVVEVTQSQYREERSFVDADELPELVKGIDAILEVKSNPTSFQNFEVRYKTKGDLQITAFSGRGGGIRYAVQAGRTLTAQTFVDEDAVRKLKSMFEAAIQLFAAQPSR